MSKLYKGLLGGASALALGIGASSVMAADLDRIEQAHSERTTALTLGIHLGHLELQDADGSDASSEFDYDAGFLGGVARLDIPMHDVYSLQLDVQGDNVLAENGTSSEYFQTGSLLGVHLNFREPDSYLIGGFLAGGTVLMAESNSGDARYWLGGIEGQYHLDDWTFYVQGGAADLKDAENGQMSDWIGDAGFARGVVRYYFNGGLGKLQGDVFYIHGAASDSWTSWVYGVEAEHHIADYSNGFITAFARFEHQDVEEDFGGGTDSTTTTTILGGLRVNLGYPDPKTRDRMGPGVDFADMHRIHANARSND